ncbi:MAG: GNAT family N-acetyltransferase [Deltaproteobacteria bacterium]|nr:GNAT family N-acetyltransferase [Deltaproteobacteria bacterium]
MTAPIRPTTPTGELAAAPRRAALRAELEAIPRLSTGFVDAAEGERVVAWLDSGLRPGRPGRLVLEYPLLFAPGSEALPITVWSGARPVSFCMLWPARFALGGGTLRTALVSLVYTDPRDRGRGLARQAIARALREAKARELGLCLLWSDLDDFYASQGFTRAGDETLLVLDADVLARVRAGSDLGLDSGSGSREEPGAESSDSAPTRVERAGAADWPAIAALRARRRCHAVLPDEGAALAQIPGLDVRVARGAEGVVAFAMCGRGDDFGGVIHEWGGDAEAVLGCCAALLDDAGPGRGLLLLSPDEPSELGWRLRAAGAQRLANPLAWFELASLPALASDLETLAPSFSQAVRLEVAAASEAAAVGIELVARRTGARCRLSPPELVALLFSKPTESRAAAARARIGSIAPAAVLAELPLPLFVWGLESI